MPHARPARCGRSRRKAVGSRRWQQRRRAREVPGTEEVTGNLDGRGGRQRRKRPAHSRGSIAGRPKSQTEGEGARQRKSARREASRRWGWGTPQKKRLLPSDPSFAQTPETQYAPIGILFTNLAMTRADAGGRRGSGSPFRSQAPSTTRRTWLLRRLRSQAPAAGKGGGSRAFRLPSLSLRAQYALSTKLTLAEYTCSAR